MIFGFLTGCFFVNWSTQFLFCAAMHVLKHSELAIFFEFFYLFLIKHSDMSQFGGPPFCSICACYILVLCKLSPDKFNAKFLGYLDLKCSLYDNTY